MSDIAIHIQVNDGDRQRVTAPSEMKASDFLKELVEGLNLPSTSGNGRRLNWKLIHKTTGRTLDLHRTLHENGVQGGQELTLRAEEPEPSPAPLTCPQCGLENEPGNKFCRKCGKPMGRVKMASDLRFHFHTHEGKEEEVEAPGNFNGLELIADVLGDAAKGHEWTVYDKDTGADLDLPKSLAENGVRSGHDLYLREVPAREGIAKALPGNPPSRMRWSFGFPWPEKQRIRIKLPPRELQDESVKFTTYCPRELALKSPNKLLAYVHLEGAILDVEKDAGAALGLQHQNYTQGSARPTQAIKRGAEIKVVPRLPGCVINPPFFQIVWTENWHRAAFQVEAKPELSGSRIAGSVSFYVGPILVAEVDIESRISLRGDADTSAQSSTAKAYSAVFVSYSHNDTEIVEDLEKAYSALGLDYLRDVRELRSGDSWNRALLQKIEEADIFQLCWSASARSSQYVEQEWRHALKQERANFIRPLYWENPMPAPPGELAGIHFAFLDLGGGSRLFRRVRRWLGWT